MVAGFSPLTPLGELTALPRPLAGGVNHPHPGLASAIPKLLVLTQLPTHMKLSRTATAPFQRYYSVCAMTAHFGMAPVVFHLKFRDVHLGLD